MANYDVEDILDRWQEMRSNPDPLEKITKKRAQFIRERAIDFSISNGRIARDYRIFVSFSSKCDTKNNSKSGIISCRDSFIIKLTSLQLAPRSCDASDLINLTRSMLQMELVSNAAATYTPHEMLSRQIVAPAMLQGIEESQINHVTTDLTSRIYHIKELPHYISLLTSSLTVVVLLLHFPLSVN